MTSVFLVTNGGGGEDGDEWILFDIYATEEAANARAAEENASRGFVEFEVEEWDVSGPCQVLQQENKALNDVEHSGPAVNSTPIQRTVCGECLRLTDEERERFRTALADAINRPMGVIPASAEGLVSPQELEAARFRIRK
jgi:hypothetical protein